MEYKQFTIVSHSFLEQKQELQRPLLKMVVTSRIFNLGVWSIQVQCHAYIHLQMTRRRFILRLKYTVMSQGVD